MKAKEEKNIEKKPKKKRKVKVRKILIILFFVWLIPELILFYFATPILKSQIQSFVEKESKGIYKIDFDEISIELTTQSLVLLGFKLIPDTAIYNKFQKNKEIKTALYEISFSGLSFKNLKIIKFIKYKNLEFDNIEIEKPKIKILALPKKNQENTEKYDAVHNDLYSVISPYMKTLAVKNILLSEGYFNLQLKSSDKTGKSVAEKISVKLHNFKLDSTAFITKEKLFYSDSLILTVNDYSLKLNDNIHNVYAQKTTISLADSFIVIKNAKIFPVDKNVKNNKQKVRYNFTLPTIKLLGIDVYKAWFNKEIYINKIEFDFAEMIIRVPKSKRKKSRKNKAKTDYKDIYTLIDNKLNAVIVNEFIFNKAKFSLFKGFNEKKPSYKIKSLTLILTNFLLNSSAYYKTDKILYAENIEMQVDDYYMKFAKNTHYLKAEKFTLSTKEKKIRAYKVKIIPDNYSAYKIRMNIKIPDLQVNNTDFIKAYNHGILNIRNFKARNSKINIVKKNTGKKKKRKKVYVIYDMISEYLNTVNINKVNISKGKFDFTQNNENDKSAFFRGEISLILNNFTIDRNTAKRSDRLFYANGFDIKLNDYSMKSGKDLNILKIKKLNLSSIDSLFNIEKLEYYPKDKNRNIDLMRKYKKSNIVHFFVDKLSFSNADIKNAIFKKELNIDSIYISNPQLFTYAYKNMYAPEQDTTKISNLFPDKNNENNIVQNDIIKKIDTQNKEPVELKKSYKKIFQKILVGSLNVVNVNDIKVDSGYAYVSILDSSGGFISTFENKMSFSIDNFKFDKDSIIDDEPLFEGNAKIEFYNYKISLPDNIHKLSIKKITYNTKDSSGKAEFVRIKPKKNIPKNLQKKNTFDLYFPEVRAKGIESEKFIYDKIISADEIFISKPEIVFTQKKDTLSAKNDKPKIIKNFKMPKKIKGFKINNLKIDTGTINISKVKDSVESTYLKFGFSINIENFYTDTTNIKNILNYDKVDFSLSNLLFNLPDEMYSVKSDSLVFSSSKKELFVKNLDLQFDTAKNISEYLNAKNKKNSYKINFYKTFVSGLDINEILYNKTLNINDIKLDNLNIEITKYKAGKKFNITEFEEKIKSKLTTKFDNFKIEKFDFSNANIKFENKINEKKSFAFENLKGGITDFDINSAENNSRLMMSKNLALNIRNYGIITPDSMHNLNLYDIKISTEEEEIAINFLEFIPRYGKYRFAEKLGFQKGVIHVKNGKVVCKGVDFRKLINEKAVDIQLVEANNFDINIFKDKHQPIDSLRRIIAPWKSVSSSKKYINIDKIKFKNANINYEEKNLKSKNTSTLNVSKLEGNISDITNDTSLIYKKKYMTMNISGFLQEDAFFRSTIFLPLEYDVEDYIIGGNIDTFDLKIFNPFLENTAFVSVQSGQVNNVMFNFDANDKYAEGMLQLNYSNLKISIIDTSKTLKKFTSFAANTLLASDNPKNKFSRLKEGKIYYERITYKSVIHLWIQSLLSGVYSTFGIKSKQMKKRIRYNKTSIKLLEKEQRLLKKNKRKEQKTIRKYEKKINKNTK